MRLSRLRKYLLALAALGLLMTACGKDDGEGGGGNEDELKILNAGIPNPVSVVPGGTVSITGSGFAEGDVIVFRSTTDYTCTTTKVDPRYIQISMPESIPSGSYDVYVTRGKQSQKLGSTRVLNDEIPDKDGATIKGMVMAAGKALAGVMVSDGFEVTTTDSNGFYWLPSAKKHGYVFISIPSGYMPAGDSGFPGFWEPLTTPPQSPAVERHDFELVEVNNDNHVIVFSADHHLANRNQDLSQFRTGFKSDLQRFLAANSSKPVYSLWLGDQSWDNYWYNHSANESEPGNWTVNYDINNFKSEVKDFNVPMFFTIGNHDYDMKYSVTNIPDATEADFMCEAAYKKALGPTYYSFNIGEVHYICVDDMIYRNTWGGSEWNRDYNSTVGNWQMEWLKKDLDLITDKTTPLIVFFHVPAHGPSISRSGIYINDVTGVGRLTNTAAFSALFSAFSDVHFVSGHTHMSNPIARSKMPAGRQNIYEHNTASVGGTWWWTGPLVGNNVSKDGVPGGYKVFEINGKDISWYWKSIGKEKDYQFRTFDMTTVKTEFNSTKYNSFFSSTVANRDRYTWAAEGTVLVNIFNWDADWTIVVEEGGRALDASKVRQVRVNDPLHVISYTYPRFAAGATPTSSFLTVPNHHMFYVQPASATSSLRIIVTDNFGNKYVEEMSRPKEFTTSMY